MGAQETSETFSFNLPRAQIYTLDRLLLERNRENGSRVSRSKFMRALIMEALEDEALKNRVLGVCLTKNRAEGEPEA